MWGSGLNKIQTATDLSAQKLSFGSPGGLAGFVGKVANHVTQLDS